MKLFVDAVLFKISGNRYTVVMIILTMDKPMKTNPTFLGIFFNEKATNIKESHVMKKINASPQKIDTF